MYRHFFWCAFRNIAIAAVSLLAKCIKHTYCVTWRNDGKMCLMTLHRTLICSTLSQNEASSSCCMQLEAGVDIRGAELGCRLGPHSSGIAVGPLFESFALSFCIVLFNGQL